MIEFIPNDHIFLIDGVSVPSVSTILNWKFPDEYAEVPKEILDKAAKRGNAIHKAIELDDPTELTPRQQIYWKEWLNLKKTHLIVPVENEKIVHYKKVYCGILDMVAEVNGKRYIIDIKTTAKLNMQRLSWQLSLYEYAYGEVFHNMYCVWLPKKQNGQFVEVPRVDRKELEECIKAFTKERAEVLKALPF